VISEAPSSTLLRLGRAVHPISRLIRQVTAVDTEHVCPMRKRFTLCRRLAAD
jgi:hypothetical protein